ncbi:hypothetical protein [Salinispora vitiensis]|uniref:hypothetical protein n=1 Tax=Salinispora vitiensis TaxID=999544 RepID=UPI000D6AA070|nr:hypothetical protein [Salinispora vitiensis]
MLRLFRRNGALRWYRRSGRSATASTWGATAVGAPAPPQQPPAWASWPTVASPQPGRVGWLTPAQTWRANGGRW